MKKEIRSSISLRADGAGDEFVLRGYAATFNNLSADLGGYRETITPGAFTRVLGTNPDVRCLVNHSADRILGRTLSGTLQLEQDNVGLKFRCMLDPNQQAHRDLHSAVKRGDLNACSFAFSILPLDESYSDDRDAQGNKFKKRTISGFSGLYDVSVVVSPAYPQTSVAARSFINTLFPSAVPKFKTDAELYALLLTHGNAEQQARALQYEARRLSKVIQRDAVLAHDLDVQEIQDRIDAEWSELQRREASRAIFPWQEN